MNRYAVIDPSGNVVNHVESEEPLKIIHTHPDHIPVLNTVGADIGWVYKNGVFSDPSNKLAKHKALPPVPFPKSMKDHESDIAALKSDIQTLTQSLTQVITALNALTHSKVAAPNV